MHPVLLYEPVKATLGLDGGFSEESLKHIPSEKENCSFLTRHGSLKLWLRHTHTVHTDAR